jgi:hypothetical protein
VEWKNVLTVERNPDPNGLPIYRELKSLAKGGMLDAAQVKWDIKNALAEANSGDAVNENALRQQLSRLQYYLRGSPDDMARAVRSLQKTIRESLNRFEGLAELVLIRAEGRPLPI